MIKYSTSQFCEPGSIENEIIGYMVDLWHEYGVISCRAILHLPKIDRDIRFWFFDSILVIPDLEFSYKIAYKLSFASMFNFFKHHPRISCDMAAAIAATVIVMETVVNRECEHWDMTTNLAVCNEEIMDYAYYKKDDNPLPF